MCIQMLLINYQKMVFSVETVARSLSEEELIEKIKDVHVLGIRSKTKVTKKVIAAAEKINDSWCFLYWHQTNRFRSL